MAPIKFEDHVKKKLDEREIQPSAGSWDQLNSRLNNSEKSSGNRWWLSAVAAVVVVLVASILFVNQQEQNSLPIVEKPAEIKEEGQPGKVQFEQPVEVASEDIEENKKNSGIAPSESEIGEKDNLVAESNSSRPTVPEKVDANKTKKSETKTSNRQQIVSVEVPEVYNRGKEFDLEKFKNDFQPTIKQEMSSEEKAEALLAQAMSKIDNSNIESVDIEALASNLLEEAEEDLDQSFRREVFEIMKEGFIKAKDAIVTRND